MKVRRGFVTNSSSTNDIFQALGTAGAAAALGTVINTVQPDENVKIITYALLETFHMPDEPKPPVIRVNDSDYVAWYYAGVRVIDVQHVKDEETKETEITVIRDEYVPSYTSAIAFDINGTTVQDWLTFGAGSPDGNVCTMIQGDYKLCGFLCESPDNDKPRKMRRTPPGMIAWDIHVDVEGKKLSKFRQTKVLDEADLHAGYGFVINDASVTTNLPITVKNKDKYTWKLDYEIDDDKLEDLARIKLASKGENSDMDALIYELQVTPRGLPLGTPEKPSNSFTTRIEVTGKSNASHIEDLWDAMDIRLIDEGLVYEGKLDDDTRLIVKSYQKATDESQVADGMEVELPPTSFKLNLVIKEEGEDNSRTAKYIDMWDTEVVVGDLKGTDQDTESFVKTYECEVEPEGTTGSYVFKPKMQVPEGDQPYILELPVKCTYEGKDYDLDIPINLKGEPFDAEAAWEQEYQNLRIIVKKYIPQERWYDILTNINDNKDRLSIEDLRLMRKGLWVEARELLTKEAAGYTREALMWEWAEWGAKWAEWIGNQAFSYLATIYAGPVLEMIITPFKEMYFTYVGTKIADSIYGGDPNLTEQQMNELGINTVFKAMENLLMNGAKDMVGGDALNLATKVSFKQIGRYFAAFAILKFANNYATGKKADGKTPMGMWDALIATFKDMTVTFFKLVVGEWLSSKMKDVKFMETINTYTIKYLKTTIVMEYPDWDDEKGIDILLKYLCEVPGSVGAKVYGKVQDVAPTGMIGQDGDDYIMTFNISSDPKKPIELKVSWNQVKEDVYNYIFNSFFGTFPFAPKAITVTDKPTYYKKK